MTSRWGLVISGMTVFLARCPSLFPFARLGLFVYAVELDLAL